MKRILVIVNNLRQASYRVRIEALKDSMRDRGFDWDIQVRPDSFFALRRFLRDARSYDSVLLQRKLLPPWAAGVLRRSARKIFYDVDDGVMFQSRQRRWLTRWKTNRAYRATARIADHVVAGNEHLAGIFRQQGCQVSVVPSVVEPAEYPVKTHQKTESPTLVWIGSGSTRPYVEQCLPQLEQARQRIAGLRLLIVADAPVDSRILPIDFVQWSETSQAEALARADIGIAPMPDDDWTRCKCGFKIVQYMAAGLPTIASPVGANAKLVQSGSTGFLPAKLDDWPNVLAQLAGDVELRASMGRRARELVESSYSVNYAADAWALILG